jgi:hypothetical protein
VFPQSFDNGTTATWLHRTRLKGRQRITSSWLRNASPPKEPMSRGRHSCSIHTPDKARLTGSLPEGNRRAALDVLSESQSANTSVLNRVRGWKQLAIDVARQATRANPEINFRNGGIASPFPSNSFRSAWEAARAQCLGHLEISFGICSNRSHQHLAGGTRALQSHQNQKQTL